MPSLFTNSLTKITETFEPFEAGQATIECCGITRVFPLGHAREATAT